MVLKLSIDHYTVVFSPVEKMQGGSRSDYFKKNWVGSVHVELGNVKNPAGEPSTSPRFPRGFTGEFQVIIPVEISS